MIPPLAARAEAWLSRFAGRAGVVSRDGDGFWSGTAVGASLGLVYAPCAGPILAGVITVSASQSFTAGRLAVALELRDRLALVLYALMLGGRRLIAPLARRGAGLQIAMGAVMVVVALGMLGNYDVRFQNSIASDLPSFLVDPTKSLESTAAARKALADVRGESAHGVGAKAAAAAAPAGGASGRLNLPVLGKAPEFVDNQRWFNTPGDRPLTLRSLRGRVVLVDFWTYTCINCLRTLALPEGVGCALSQGRSDDRRDPLARVPVRERRRQRRRHDRAQRPSLSHRPGQRPRDLERLRQPVLAGRVFRRRPGQRPLRPLRRGLLRREREGDPRAAR